MNVKNVCGVPMGGLPGQSPALLVGSMFFDRQKLVKDAKTGRFDHTAAKELLKLQDKWSETTGNPACVDVIGSTPDAIRRYLDFIIEHFDGPIMVDGSDADVKIAGVRHMAQCNMIHRTIYNSISPETVEDEFEAIAECGVKSAVILAVSSTDFSTDGKIDLLEKPDGLIAKANACGIENCMVDPGVIDLLSVGTVKSVMAAVKEMGHFTGSAPHNAMGTWPGLNEKLGTDFRKPATAVLNALPIAWGADFVIYGPLNLAPVVFPAAAMVDVILSQALMEAGQVPDSSHPMFKIA